MILFLSSVGVVTAAGLWLIVTGIRGDRRLALADAATLARWRATGTMRDLTEHTSVWSVMGTRGEVAGAGYADPDPTDPDDDQDDDDLPDGDEPPVPPSAAAPVWRLLDLDGLRNTRPVAPVRGCAAVADDPLQPLIWSPPPTGRHHAGWVRTLTADAALAYNEAAGRAGLTGVLILPVITDDFDPALALLGGAGRHIRHHTVGAAA